MTIPKVRSENVDLRSLPLSPLDGFVLSRVDGQLSPKDIAATTGLDEDAVMLSLAKLASLNVIDFDAPPSVLASLASGPSPTAPSPAMPPRGDSLPPVQDARVQSSPPRSTRDSAPSVGIHRTSPSSRVTKPPPPTYPSGSPPGSNPNGPASARPTLAPKQPFVPPEAAASNRPSPGSNPPERTPSIAPQRGSTRPLSVIPPSGNAAKSPSSPSAASKPPSTPNLRIGSIPPSPSMLAEEAVRYDPKELEEQVDLEPEVKKRVLDLYYRLEEMHHYAVLDVPRSADKKTIKRAYFELAAKFHPDRYFRKNLGSFKLKMEAIFGRMTRANEVLTSKTERVEYDAYLATQQKTRGFEALMEDAMREVRRADRAAKLDAKIDVRGATEVKLEEPPNDATARASAAPGTGQRLPFAGMATSPSKAPQPVDAKAARDALARRLTGQRAPVAPKVPTIAYATSSDAVDALKRRYEEKMGDTRKKQAAKYVEVANEAKRAKDIVAAANAYRVALSFNPDDPELQRLAEETQREADVTLCDTYLKQANYEEKNERWAEAAKSWARVARAKPDDALAHERAAHALLKAAGNLREASNLAKRAVALEANNATFRHTLGLIYLNAGLTLNARREIEAAHAIAPNDAAIRALHKQLQTED